LPGNDFNTLVNIALIDDEVWGIHIPHVIAEDKADIGNILALNAMGSCRDNVRGNEDT
jgi:hypothetical protein